METKVSSRAKILLIVLAIILVIFGAVMVPTYGIKDMVVNLKETRSKINEQRDLNTEALTALTETGVSAAYAESPSQAADRLRKDILESKYDAIKFQQMSLSAKAYAVADQWLTPVKYVHFESGNTVIYASVSVSNNEGGFADSEIILEDVAYDTEEYSCMFSFVASDEEKYVLELDYLAEDANVNSLSLLVAIYNVLQERGSVIIDDWTLEETGATMSLTLIIPAESKIDEYAAEIGECEHCGKPYYIADYYAELEELPEGETEVKCTDCEQPLTGKPLN